MKDPPSKQSTAAKDPSVGIGSTDISAIFFRVARLFVQPCCRAWLLSAIGENVVKGKPTAENSVIQAMGLKISCGSSFTWSADCS